MKNIQSNYLSNFHILVNLFRKELRESFEIFLIGGMIFLLIPIGLEGVVMFFDQTRSPLPIVWTLLGLLGWLYAIVMGAHIVARDLGKAEGHFFFALPISPYFIIAVKLLAGIFLLFLLGVTGWSWDYWFIRNHEFVLILFLIQVGFVGYLTAFTTAVLTRNTLTSIFISLLLLFLWAALPLISSHCLFLYPQYFLAETNEPNLPLLGWKFHLTFFTFTAICCVIAWTGINRLNHLNLRLKQISWFIAFLCLGLTILSVREVGNSIPIKEQIKLKPFGEYFQNENRPFEDDGPTKSTLHPLSESRDSNENLLFPWGVLKNQNCLYVFKSSDDWASIEKIELDSNAKFVYGKKSYIAYPEIRSPIENHSKTFSATFDEKGQLLLQIQYFSGNAVTDYYQLGFQWKDESLLKENFCIHLPLSAHHLKVAQEFKVEDLIWGPYTYIILSKIENHKIVEQMIYVYDRNKGGELKLKTALPKNVVCRKFARSGKALLWKTHVDPSNLSPDNSHRVVFEWNLDHPEILTDENQWNFNDLTFLKLASTPYFNEIDYKKMLGIDLKKNRFLPSWLTWFSGGDTDSWYFYKNTAYIMNLQGLTIIQKQNKNDLEIVGNYPFSPLSQILHESFGGNLCLLGSTTLLQVTRHNIFFYDVSNPSSPKQLGFLQHHPSFRIDLMPPHFLILKEDQTISVIKIPNITKLTKEDFSNFREIFKYDCLAEWKNSSYR